MGEDMGCPKICEDLQSFKKPLEEIPCEDTSLETGRAAFNTLADNYIIVVENWVPQFKQLITEAAGFIKESGCGAVSKMLEVTRGGISLCFPPNLRPLTTLCPVTCQCADLGL